MGNIGTSKTIEVKSLIVLEEISKNKCMGLLNKVIRDETDDKHRPIYVFKYADNLMEVINRFMYDPALGERSLDGDRWDSFNTDAFYGANKENIVITRNYRIINDIFEAGYAGNLCASFYGKDNKRGFVFIANDEIREIKAKGDAESKAMYEAKMKKQENTANE